MASPPRVRAFLFCDGVVRDPVSGKTTLVGVFETLDAYEFPLKQPPFAVYLRLTSLNGRYRFAIEVVSVDLLAVIRSVEVDDEFESDNPLEVLDWAIELDEIVWPAPGRYTVLLIVNGLIAEEATLAVEDHS